jgi:hypothetical protein
MRIPSSIQNNALSTRLLIGDTLYHHNPDPSPTVSARLGAPSLSNTEQEKAETIVKLMPNPNQGVFQVQILDGLQGPFHWEMVDLTGRLMLSGQSNHSMFTIQASQLSKGIYLLKMRAPNGTKYKIERVVIR